MRHFVILYLFIFTASFYGQENSAPKFYKNEIGIDLLPALRIRNDFSSIRSTLFYKRAIAENLYLRTQFSATQYNNNRGVNAEVLYSLDGKNYILSYKRNITLPVYQYDAGLEYRWGKKSLKYFAGADIGFYNLKEFSNFYWGLAPYNSIIPYKEQYFISKPDERKDEMIYQSRANYNVFVLTPLAGVQFHFSNRWFFSTQLGLPIERSYLRYEDQRGENPIESSGKMRYLEINNRRIFSNFSLCHKF